MSEETRIVEEQAEQETDAVAEVSQPEAEVETAPEVTPQATSDAVAIDSEDQGAVELSAESTDTSDGNEEETSEAESEDTGTGHTSEDGKHVVYLDVGQEVTGTVKRTTDFGAFVDIGAGRDGLIHISELAVGRVNKVMDVVKEGQQVTAWIKKLDRKRNRISLTLIAPGTKTLKDLKEGEVVTGTVSKLMPYGAFIDLGVGTDALLHIREMSTGYVNKPEDVVKPGESLEVRIISVDRRRRRIDLSIKGLREEPEAEQPVEAVAEPEDEASSEDPFAEVEVLSPMELAFKRAMEAEGIELDVKKNSKKANRRGKKRNRSIQDEIISRTLESMRE
jgi:transcriptional accessory protein Tex/SPT6